MSDTVSVYCPASYRNLPETTKKEPLMFKTLALTIGMLTAWLVVLPADCGRTRSREGRQDHVRG